MKLRMHHLLCLPLYQGAGYSRAFCIHLEEVLRKLAAGDGMIQILDAPDELCTACPNLRPAPPKAQDGSEAAAAGTQRETLTARCESEERIRQKDRELLSWTNLKRGKRYTGKELRARLLETITEERFFASCKNCQWMQEGLCDYERWRAALLRSVIFDNNGPSSDVLYSKKYKKK